MEGRRARGFLVRLTRSLLIGLQFFSIIPIRLKGDISEEDIVRSSAMFPLVGALFGLFSVCSAIILTRLFPAGVSGGLLLALLAILNGGFHLDGLADTFDGLAVKATGDAASDRERMLEVMKDSTTGAAGATAIAAAILLKYVLISDLLLSSSSNVLYSVLFLVPVFSKWVAVVSLYSGTAARRDGIGRIFIGKVTKDDLVLSTVIVIGLSLSAAEFLQQTLYATAAVYLVAAFFAVSLAVSLAAVRFFGGRLGGLTGDTLGAVAEVSEIFLLMAGSLWLRHSI